VGVLYKGIRGEQDIINRGWLEGTPFMDFVDLMGWFVIKVGWFVTQELWYLECLGMLSYIWNVICDVCNKYVVQGVMWVVFVCICKERKGSV